MAFGKKRGWAVHLDGPVLRLVEADAHGGRLRVARALRASLPPDAAPSPENLGGLLRSLLDREGVRCDRALAVLPAGRVLFRRFVLPAGDRGELEAMIRFQAQKALPVSEGAAKVGFFLQDGPGGGFDVTVVGALHDVLGSVRKTFETAGLRLEGVTVSALGSFRALADAPLPDGEDGDTVVADVGPQGTDVVVLREGRLLFTRHCPVGSSSLPGGEGAPERTGPLSADERDWADRLAADVELSLRSFRAEHEDAAPARLWVGGRAAARPEMLARLSERTGLPASAAAGHAPWESDAGAPADPHGFLAAAGALRADMTRNGAFDLTAPFFTQAGRKKSRLRPYLAAGAALCVLAALVMVPDQILREKEAEVAALRDAVERMEKEDLARMEELAKRAEELRSWTRERDPWLDVLLEIARRKPDPGSRSRWGVYLTSLRLREKEPIRLNGRALSESDITSFARLLQQSPLFRSADTTSFQKSDRKDDYPWSYEIVATLREKEESP